MKIEILKIDKDGYNLAQVLDDTNYLNYMFRPELNKWQGLNGNVNGTSIRNDFAGWQKNGRGKLSQKTIDIQRQMSEYFHNEIDNITLKL